MSRRATFVSSVLAIALAMTASHAAFGACTDAGACGANRYCAHPDGGAVTDGGAGVCAPEPCVVTSDCTGVSEICDTSREPHACVHVDAGAPHDAGLDASAAVDAAAPIDGAAPAPPRDASDASDDDSSADGSVDDPGALRGGACDCDLATRGTSALAPLGAPLVAIFAFLARRRRRSPASRRD